MATRMAEAEQSDITVSTNNGNAVETTTEGDIVTGAPKLESLKGWYARVRTFSKARNVVSYPRRTGSNSSAGGSSFWSETRSSTASDATECSSSTNVTRSQDGTSCETPSRQDSALTTTPIRRSHWPGIAEENDRETGLGEANASTTILSQRTATISDFIAWNKDVFEASKLQPSEGLRRRWASVLETTLRDRIRGMHLGQNDISVFALRMVGSKPDAVCMRPTILVVCSDHRRKEIDGNLRKFMKVVDFNVDLVVLAQSTRGMGRIRLSSKSSDLPSALDDRIGMLVELESDYGNSLMGQLCRVVLDSEGRCYPMSTIGGIISVGGMLYALTVAHSMFQEDQSDSNRKQDFGGHGQWTSSEACGTVEAYRWSEGEGAKADSESSFKTPCAATDWMLVKVSEQFCLPNIYSTLEIQEQIEGFILTGELSDGGVWICAGNSGIQSGMLSSTSVLLAVGQVSYDVRSIALERPLKDGDSGSWVIRNNKVCGCIFARMEGLCLAYMLPIEQIFESIETVYSTDAASTISIPRIGAFMKSPVPAIEGSRGTGGNAVRPRVFFQPATLDTVTERSESIETSLTRSFVPLMTPARGEINQYLDKTLQHKKHRVFLPTKVPSSDSDRDFAHLSNTSCDVEPKTEYNTLETMTKTNPSTFRRNWRAAKHKWWTLIEPLANFHLPGPFKRLLRIVLIPLPLVVVFGIVFTATRQNIPLMARLSLIIGVVGTLLIVFFIDMLRSQSRRRRRIRPIEDP